MCLTPLSAFQHAETLGLQQREGEQPGCLARAGGAEARARVWMMAELGQALSWGHSEPCA